MRFHLFSGDGSRPRSLQFIAGLASPGALSVAKYAGFGVMNVFLPKPDIAVSRAVCHDLMFHSFQHYYLYCIVYFT